MSSVENSPAVSRDFAGWGKVEYLDFQTEMTAIYPRHQIKLGQWKSTAICGNDITSSCLYVSALCAMYAGIYAPVSLLIVAGVLYIFRSIYAEVGSALPLNGGAYNVLLNTTSKQKASLAACLTLLSYLATAVISASEAMHYAHNLWPGLNVFWATIVLLAAFAFLNIMGISESAMVALILFSIHMITLLVLIVAGGIAVAQNRSILLENLTQPLPGSVWTAISFGFASAMLGLSGFESSANFIEEQDKGVFPKTLRNMWLAVTIFNPTISFLSLGLVKLSDLAEHKNDLLAYMGLLSLGRPLQLLVSVDAVLVLSGAVLTSYVGVAGLVKRMALDRCLPQFLLIENRFRGTTHWIFISFFLLCSSILIVTKGRIEALAGVYTLSFLCVMGLFALGNAMLKVKRSSLPREVQASWISILIGLLAVFAGILGNIFINPEYLKIFFFYFLFAASAVWIMLYRIHLLNFVLLMLDNAIKKIKELNQRVSGWITKHIERINSQAVVFFSKGDNISTLNKAALYVLQNEQTKHLRVVHCYETDNYVSSLKQQIEVLDRIYPELRIDLVCVRGQFGPELIERLSKKLGVPKNYMFIGTPGDRFPHNISDLGGVRLIM
ncbi:MAG: APC family permease [Acidobacteriota bacterium]|nr:APC family permease [Blastocatellia bacterium]MDW8411633.1 APC family permease [Acidobacteriota bacterium]